MDTDREDITAFLEAVGAGDEGALDEVFIATYTKLRQMAYAQRARWQGQETLSPTALVHEAYLKLAQQDLPRWRDRAHFFAVAARAMRHILINYAERRQASKRGGDAVNVSTDDAVLVDDAKVEQLLALDEALAKLEADNPRRARVVECRFFAGLDIGDTAEALNVSPATVKRDWTAARAQLNRALRRFQPAADEESGREGPGE